MKFFLAFLVLLFLFAGCASKKKFEPEIDYKNINYTDYTQFYLIDSRIDGATYEDGSIVAKSGFYEKIAQNKETLFINETDEKLLLSNKSELIIVDKKDNSSTIIQTAQRVVSANMQNGIISAVLADNTIAIYDEKSKDILFKSKQKPTTAVTNKVAKPIFFDDLIIFPTLDGKIIVVDKKSKRELREFMVSSEKYFNNIIFLKIIKDKIITATKNAIYIITPRDSHELKIELNDIFADENSIVAVATNGKVLELDFALSTKNEIKFPFAGLISITQKDNKFYMLERSGFLIVLDRGFLEYSIYELRDNLENHIFVDNEKIYYKKRFIKLP